MAAAAAAAARQQQQQHQSHQVPHSSIPPPPPPPPPSARPPPSILSAPLVLTASGDSARLSDLSQVSPSNGNGAGGSGAKNLHLPYSEEPMSPNGEFARLTMKNSVSEWNTSFADSESDEAKRRRSRTNFSQWQLEELERVFQSCHYPDVFMREAMALKLDLKESRISVSRENVARRDQGCTRTRSHGGIVALGTHH